MDKVKFYMRSIDTDGISTNTSCFFLIMRNSGRKRGRNKYIFAFQLSSPHPKNHLQDTTPNKANTLKNKKKTKNKKPMQWPRLK